MIQTMPRDKKPEEGAPAYMAQFTALMTILLAFFICMLSLGSTREAEYKDGIGNVRDAFGVSGGLGLLPYWKAIMNRYPKIDADSEEVKRNLIGYRRGTFQSDILSLSQAIRGRLRQQHRSVRIMTPIRFAVGSAVLDADARAYLSSLGQVVFAMRNCQLAICCYAPDDAQGTITLSAMRAAAVSRYLAAACGLPQSSLSGIGYAHTKYLGELDEATQATVVFVSRRSTGS
jgi:chemotaxis protein MotB